LFGVVGPVGPGKGVELGGGALGVLLDIPLRRETAAMVATVATANSRAYPLNPFPEGLGVSLGVSLSDPVPGGGSGAFTEDSGPCGGP
jgi:hypothetical protein